MTNAESAESVSRDLENANSESSHVAVSEENLAALLGATLRSAEPEAQHLAKDADKARVFDANGLSAAAPQTDSARPPAVASPPVNNVVESRLALFAAVKENRSAISRSGVLPATPGVVPAAPGVVPTTPGVVPVTPLVNPSAPGEANTTAGTAVQGQNLSGGLPPKVARRQTIVPAPALPVPAPLGAPSVVPVAMPSRNAVSNKPTNNPSDNPALNTQRARLLIGLAAAAVLAAIGVSIFLVRAHASKAPIVAASAPKDNVPPQAQVEPTPLQVRVEPLGKGLIDVRWNPQSAMITQARDGRLVITEPNQKPRILPLESGQLKTGHLTYQSMAESIEFDLEITDRSGATVKESVLAMQSPTSSPQPTGIPPQMPREQAATAQTQNIPSQPAIAEVPQVSQAPVRTFVAPVAQRNTEQRAILDAPTVTNGAVVPPQMGLSVPLPAIAPPPKKEAPVVQQQVRVESNVEAANLIKTVVPVYPQIARAARIQGTVRFTAHIGKDGRILNLKFMNGPSVLVDSASAAVKQWVYRPTLLDGQPVEVITQIDVNFTLNSTIR
jgi:periplasmic protein TonB